MEWNGRGVLSCSSVFWDVGQVPPDDGSNTGLALRAALSQERAAAAARPPAQRRPLTQRRNRRLQRHDVPKRPTVALVLRLGLPWAAVPNRWPDRRLLLRLPLFICRHTWG